MTALVSSAYAEDAAPEEETSAGDNVHEALYKGEEGKPYYPSASECKQCHPDHYREWAVSPHAYAQMSPVFNAMHAKILKLTNGTNGDFCIRCHTPVGMNLFIASYRFNKPITELYQATIPFMLILMLAVLIITYVPWLSLWFI